jgi:hypothetical protein
MASTINLQATVTWSLPYIDYQPLTIGGPDPAVTNANLVKQTMLGPPFTWPWNRVESAPIDCVAETQDYVAALDDFGFIEMAWVEFDGDIKEVKNKRTISKDGTFGRPEFIAAQLDDNAGNITFRLMPCPDKAYVLTVVYQRKASKVLSLAGLWSPIPDELSYIFNYGFLALGMPLTDDPQFQTFNDRFIAHLLSAQDGLDEMQRNIFIANWLDVTKQIQRSGMQAQQGTLSRTR